MNANRQFYERPARTLQLKGKGGYRRDHRSGNIQMERMVKELGESKRGIAQRMAVITVPDMNQEEDLLVWDNMEHASVAAPGAIGDLGSNKVWDRLGEDEEIRLVHHGKETDKDKHLIGNVSAQDIVNSMNSPECRIPDFGHIKKIVFQSCFAGTNGLIEQMKNLLDPIRSDIPIEGRTGIAYGFKGMSNPTVPEDESTERQIEREEATTTPAGRAAYKDYMDTHHDAQTKSGLNLFDYELCTDGKQHSFYKKPWEILPLETMKSRLDSTADEHLSTLEDPRSVWNSLKPEVKMQLVANEMVPYWASYSRDMPEGTFKDEQAHTGNRETDAKITL